MPDQPCERCPARGYCLRWEAFCAGMRADPPDPVHVAHVRNRSAMGAAPAHPPLAIQAGNLGRALWDWAVSGFAMTTEEEVSRRLTICRECPQWDAGRCRICGCTLEAKVRLRTAHCPLEPPRW
jgi:hypothetical protein